MSLDNLPAKIEYAERMAASTMLPRQYQRQPANLLWAMAYAEALGMDHMAAITGINVIEGKPSASADLIAALVRNAGHKLRISGDDNSATAQIIRSDDPDYEGFKVTWTLGRAVRAGLCQLRDGKPYARSRKGEILPWEKYPAALLRARAITEVARMAASECLHGVKYTPEELEKPEVEVTRADRPTPEPIRALPADEMRELAEAYRADVVEAADEGNADSLTQLWRAAAQELPEAALLSAYVLVPAGWHGEGGEDLDPRAEPTDDGWTLPLGELIKLANRCIQDGVVSGEGVIDISDADLAMAEADGPPEVSAAASQELDRRAADAAEAPSEGPPF